MATSWRRKSEDVPVEEYKEKILRSKSYEAGALVTKPSKMRSGPNVFKPILTLTLDVYPQGYYHYQMPSSVRDMDSHDILLDSPNSHYGLASLPISIPTRSSHSIFFSEFERLKTYEGWPVDFLPPEIMAKAGFYYTKRDDVVKCPFCFIEVARWEEGDDPWDDHRKWRPACKFINGEPGNGNIPLGQEQMRSVTPPSPNDSGYDTCGSQDIRGMDLRHTNSRLPEQGVSSSIYRPKSPAFPMYATEEDRLKSYSLWPVSLKIKPNVLSEAGFYYTGKGDQTVCFYCGGGLKDWEDSDDPWTEHAKWFAKCNYVLLHKGEQFVENARKSNVKGLLKADQEKQTGIERDAPLSSQNSGNASESETVACSSSDKGSSSSGDAMLCKVCYGRPLQVVFLPCGHLVSCIECSVKLKTCCFCRQNITGVVRTFLP